MALARVQVLEQEPVLKMVLARVLVLVRKLALERKVRKATKVTKALELVPVRKARKVLVMVLVRRPPLAQKMLRKLAKVLVVQRLMPTL